MDLTSIRKHIKATRRAMQLTQDSVAADAGVAQSVISRLEDIATEMAEVEFETIRKVVEEGLGVALPKFLQEAESGHEPSKEQTRRDNHGRPVPQPAIDANLVIAAAETVAETIAEAIHKAADRFLEARQTNRTSTKDKADRRANR